ncbi:hypothetical protein HDV00_002532 [Rhizophlyctis rosea]|nr:hypothetical protein HDV00_002532 [Rhizophlyctis rosea]
MTLYVNMSKGRPPTKSSPAKMPAGVRKPPAKKPAAPRKPPAPKSKAAKKPATKKAPKKTGGIHFVSGNKKYPAKGGPKI